MNRKALSGERRVLAVVATAMIWALPAAAHAQAPPQATPQAPVHPPGVDRAASMVKPPQAASDAVNADNPDNMPVKRPRKPVNEGMAREPPASGGTAK
ncbi:hypothetical protein [Paraburkholderia kururiensis]|uniref:hypothetical protein n=1 Tax=Paraburkholderia kururiensis TaxID=984307 RepID=UPI000694BD06|nr:hypothetical protein [Paraburkholderia kururiensis]